MKHNHKTIASATLGLLMPVLLLFVACKPSDKAQPVSPGKDNCTACGMTIEDPKFACEYITGKGKCYKFDDVSCLFHYLHKQNIADSTLLKIYVADYETPDSLIDIKHAALVLGQDIKSPMNGGVAAFKNSAHAAAFAKQTQSILLDTWERLRIQHAEH